MQAAEPFIDEAGDLPVRGFLYRSDVSGGNGMVLTHGAGGNSQSPLLAALGHAFSEAGVAVLCCDLPFRQLRPKGPPSPSSSKRDQDGLRNAITALRRLVTGRVFLGGQSYGGRQASMVAASDVDLVSGLLLLSYPLHPPGKPSQLRTSHFPRLRMPALFVQGSRDPFGTLEEVSSAIKLIPARTQLLPVEGVGHSLALKRTEHEVSKTVLTAFSSFFDAELNPSREHR